MAKLILVSTAQTDWQAQGRLVGDIDLPLNEYGHRQAIGFAEAIAPLLPTEVRCGPERATKQTASVIAHQLGLKVHASKELKEMDLGHWEGLTQDELRERFGRVYRQWRSDPLSVEPPEGETVSQTAQRLRKGIHRIVKREAEATVALVLGQFAYAIAQCEFVERSYDRFWEHIDGDIAWLARVIDMTEEDLMRGPTGSP